MAKNSEEVVDRKFLLFIFQYIETQRETTAGKDTGPFIVEQFNCQEYKQGEKFPGETGLAHNPLTSTDTGLPGSKHTLKNMNAYE